MKIIIVGDYCTDIKVMGSVDRLNPEAPVPILDSQISAVNFAKNMTNFGSRGMAGNVYENMLNILPALYESDILTVYTPPQDVDVRLLSYDGYKDHPVKLRFLDEKSGYILLRVDFPFSGVLPRFKRGEFLRHFEQHGVECVVISDYDKGYLSVQDINWISSLCKTYRVPCMIDTKKPVLDLDDNFTYIKINNDEYHNSFTNIDKTPYNMFNLIVTRGAKGAELVNTGIKSIADDISVRDVCGAGDAFLAALVVLTIASDIGIRETLYLCNQISGEVCKSHNSSITMEAAEKIFNKYAS